MSGFVYQSGAHTGAWHHYLEREHAAQGAYLATVRNAQAEYLTGPWPDRTAYEHVERSAWVTYYAAGREAWRQYKAEITPLPPPATQDRPAFHPHEASGELNEFDQRQETYLTTDPTRRDVY